MPRTGKSPAERMVVYYETSEDIFIMPGVKATPGCWRAVVEWPGTRDRSVAYAGSLLENAQVGKEEFDKHKQLSADLLSFHTSTPAALRW